MNASRANPVRGGAIAVASLLVLAGCDAFSAHTDRVARVADHELTVGRVVGMFVGAQPLPHTREVVDGLARNWIDLTVFARRMAEGDSLLDSASVLEAMWFEVRQVLNEEWADRLKAERLDVGPAVVDSAFRAGELRMFAHVLRRVTPADSAGTNERQYATIERIHQRLTSGGTWAEANEQNEDQQAKALDGNLGVVRRGQTVPRFENAAFAMAPGELSSIVETEFGFHIIYRPRLEEVRDLFAAFVREDRAVDFDASYGQQLLEEMHVEVHASAPAQIRAVAEAPLRALESSGVLATHRDGRFTEGQFVRWLRYLPAATRTQLGNAPDDQILYFTRQVVLQELLASQADSAGVLLSDTAYTAIREQYARAVAGLWDVVGIAPDSLAAAGSTLAEREQIARERVDVYFERFAAGTVDLQSIPPLLADRLRAETDWDLLPAGIARVLERLDRFRELGERLLVSPMRSNQP
ncbi:MAG: peptidylprolyl isomerase [Gemmatimonadetes bacterium]|nr:peptidylprolyl isomerase [Gemmatimonadota bacterium]